MVLRSVFLSLLVSLLFSCSGESAGTSAVKTRLKPEVLSGKALFDQNCAACHGNDGKLGASGAKDLTNSQINDEEISKIIRLGKNGMPPMESLLGSEENIKSVTDYVKSMRK